MQPENTRLSPIRGPHEPALENKSQLFDALDSCYGFTEQAKTSNPLARVPDFK